MKCQRTILLTGLLILSTLACNIPAFTPSEPSMEPPSATTTSTRDIGKSCINLGKKEACTEIPDFGICDTREIVTLVVMKSAIANIHVMLSLKLQC